MKTLLLTIFLSLNIFALSVSNIQESYERLNHTTDGTVAGLTLSLFIGLFIGSLLSRKLSQYKKDALSQNIIRDLEDEQTNLINQISYIEAQNEHQILELEKKTLHVEEENEILINKNQELESKMINLKDSHVIQCEELNKKANKAIEDKKTLFRQIEETIILDNSK
jgi:hypothetical protein